MKLARLAEAVGLDAGSYGDAQVTGFAIDHRKVAPGTVFGAFQGTVANGEDFVPAAVAAGAIAVVARPEVAVIGAAHLSDPQPRRAFARPAFDFGRPTTGLELAALERQPVLPSLEHGTGDHQKTHQGAGGDQQFLAHRC